jgi:hypothetical protein
MFHGGGRCARFAGAFVLLLIVASCSSSPAETTIDEPTTTKPIVNQMAEQVGPLLSRNDTAEVSIGRDGGITVPLPNGRDLWVFGDTPRYEFREGAWKLTGFIQGSSAGIVDLVDGELPTEPVDEVVVGQPHSPTNQPTQFLAPPVVYMPDGSGRECTKENAGPSAGMARWATGAALMPDETNVLVTFTDVCVIDAATYHAEGYGFALYDWKANTFTVPPYDVIAPQKNGREISTVQYFGSPIIDGDQVTLFSSTCCKAGSSVYVTTLAADADALKQISNYDPQPVLGLQPSFLFNVSPPSSTHDYLSMYRLTGLEGQFQVLTADKPTGPWTIRAAGTLPGCATAPTPCNNSLYLHPELSSSDEFVISYYLYGYGPGIPDHPDPSDQINQVLFARVPL